MHPDAAFITYMITERPAVFLAAARAATRRPLVWREALYRPKKRRRQPPRSRSPFTRPGTGLDFLGI